MLLGTGKSKIPPTSISETMRPGSPPSSIAPPDEPPSARDQQPSRHRGPRPAGPHAYPGGGRGRRLARQPGAGDTRQHYLVGVAALQPTAQSGGAHLALSAQPLACLLGLLQPGRHHGRLRDGVEPLRRRPRLGPFAVRRRLGAWLAPGLIRALYTPIRPVEGSRSRDLQTVAGIETVRKTLGGVQTGPDRVGQFVHSLTHWPDLKGKALPLYFHSTDLARPIPCRMVRDQGKNAQHYPSK